MDFLYNIYIDLVIFFERGGNVLFLIATVIFVMWSLIFERVLYFWGGHGKLLRQSLNIWKERRETTSWGAFQVRLLLLSQFNEKVSSNMAIITTCVALCPLLGLLGTVTGMITVFDSMANQGGNARSMAAGVSLATIPTMAGMVGSLSGLFAVIYLQRKVNQESELFESRLILHADES